MDYPAAGRLDLRFFQRGFPKFGGIVFAFWHAAGKSAAPSRAVLQIPPNTLHQVWQESSLCMNVDWSAVPPKKDNTCFQKSLDLWSKPKSIWDCKNKFSWRPLENLDLDLHLSVSDRGRLVLQIPPNTLHQKKKKCVTLSGSSTQHEDKTTTKTTTKT